MRVSLVAVLLPTALGQMVITTYPGSVVRNPGGEPVGNVPTLGAAMATGISTSASCGLVGGACTPAQLLAASNGQCTYLEGPFEAILSSVFAHSGTQTGKRPGYGFQYPAINLTRWKPIANPALDHCPSPGAVGAANAATCTAMLSSQMQFGVQLPGYPTGDIGLQMTLSQKPCANGGCCVGNQCANWAGAHLSSLGCIQYGVLETEAMFNIPSASGGVFFAGTYIYGSTNNLDSSWNEVDQTIINGANGLEFHGSLFLSNPPTQNNAQEDKDVFDSTGTQCNSYAPAVGTPGNLKGKSIPYTCPIFSTQFASSYHTYKIVWTPNWIAWLIDTTLYRNSTAAPWRPVTMRPLLRTNVGTAASVAVLPDANVYIRRIRYTPLGLEDVTGSKPQQVLTDALTSPSMATKYGSMISNAAGALLMSSSAASAAGRRLLLQSNGDQLTATGSVVPNPSVTLALTDYQKELNKVTNIAQTVVAQAIPGVQPSQVSVQVTGHTITGIILVTGGPFSAWTPAVQSNFLLTLSQFVTPALDQVLLNSVSDSSVPQNWWAQNISAQMPAVPPPGVLVQYTIDGYVCGVSNSSSTQPANMQSATACADAGYGAAAKDVLTLDVIDTTSNVGQALIGTGGTAFSPRASITDVSPVTASSPSGNGLPAISAVIQVGINVPVPQGPLTASNASGPTPSSIMEAQFDAALNSGMIGNLLASQGIEVQPPTNLQTARNTRNAALSTTCPASVTTEIYMTAGWSSVDPIVRNIIYAVISVLGTLLFLTTFAVCVLLGMVRAIHEELKRARRASTQMGKMAIAGETIPEEKGAPAHQE